MNKLLILFSTFLITSCDNNSATTTGEITENDSVAVELTTVDSMCYVYTNNHNDTVAMQIINSNGKVNGTLMYNYFEKDKNTGTLTGNMNGDTLIADYQFMSEGVQSVREVVFVRMNNAWLQGYGEMLQDGNKMKFADRSKLVFDITNKLEQSNCK